MTVVQNRFLILILGILALPCFVAAQTLEDLSWGFRFQVPSGWKAKKESAGAILGHDRIAGLIMVLPHAAGSMDELRSQMLEGLDEDGFQLRLASDPSAAGKNVLAAPCEGYANGELVKGRAFGVLSPGGGGAYVLAISTPEKYGRELADAAGEIVRGMQFPKKSASDLMAHLAGTWVNATTNTETRLTLKSNGEYFEGYESSYSGKSNDQYGNQDLAWGTAGQGSRKGKWSVRGTREKGVITLTSSQGTRSTFEYGVHVEKGETYWNEYWFDGKLYGRSR